MSNLTASQCATEIFIEYTWDPGLEDVARTIEGGLRSKMMFSRLCCYYSALTWAVFDHVLTFHDEVIYVWKRPLRAGSILFYIMRYLGIASLLAGTAIILWPEWEYAFYDVDYDGTLGGSCGYPTIYQLRLAGESEAIAYRAVPALQFSVFWVVEVILQTRIFALYGSTRLAVVNGLVFTLEIAAMISLWYKANDLMGALPTHRVLGSSVEWHTYSAFYWIPGVVFELWLAALAFRKLKPQVLKHDLLSVIVQDSIRYFILIAIVMMLHIISTLNAFGVGLYVVPFVIAGQTIGGSRLVLHLRRAYFRSHDFEVSRPGGISFAARTTEIPVPRGFFRDETFYVQESPRDEEFVEEAL